MMSEIISAFNTWNKGELNKVIVSLKRFCRHNISAFINSTEPTCKNVILEIKEKQKWAAV